MPLDWDEVKTGMQMKDFNIFNAVSRLKETGDLFKGVLGRNRSGQSSDKSEVHIRLIYKRKHQLRSKKDVW